MKNYDTVKLVEMWNQDKPVNEIAKALDISSYIVRYYAKNHPEECNSRKNSKFSHKEYDKILLTKLWNEKKATKEIAEILGVSIKTVTNYVKAHPESCELRPKIMTKKYDEGKLVEMWNQDKPVNEIAKSLGVSITTVRNYAKEHPERCKTRRVSISKDIKRTKSSLPKIIRKKYDKEKLISMWNDNISTQEIAQVLGISVGIVRYYARTHPEVCKPRAKGRIKANKSSNRFDEEKLISMWNENISVKKIARVLEIQIRAIREYVEKHPEECNSREDSKFCHKEYDKKLLVKLWNDDTPTVKIAKTLGVSTATVGNYAKAHPELCKVRPKLRTRKYDEAKLVEMWNQDEPVKEIAKAFGISSVTVIRYVKKHLAVCKVRTKKYNEKKLISMWNADISTKEIAKVLSIDPETVRYYAKTHPETCKIRKLERARKYNEKKLISMWNADISTKEIAKALSISPSTVNHYAKTHPETCKTRKPKIVRKYDEEKLISMWNADISTKEIAKVLSILPETVRRYAKTHPEACKIRKLERARKYDEEKLISMWNADISTKEIAKVLSVDPETVRYYAKTHPETCKIRETKRAREYDKEKLISMWNEDIPVKEIAKALSISPSTVKHYAKNHTKECQKRSKIRVGRKYDANKLVRLYNKYISADIIAKELGVSRSTVLKHIRLHRDECAKRNVKYDTCRLVIMWQSGMSAVKISTEIGISESVVNYYLQKHFAKNGHYNPQEIVAMHKNGRTVNEISEDIGISKNLVSLCLKHQPQKHFKKSSSNSSDDIISMWNEDFSISTISKKLGISYAAVAKFVSRHRDLCPYRKEENK